LIQLLSFSDVQKVDYQFRASSHKIAQSQKPLINEKTQ